MAGGSPEESFDALIERFRQAIACIGDAHVFGDGYEPGQPHAIAMKPYRTGFKDYLQLNAQESGQPDLLLNVIHEYTVVHVPNDQERGPYKVRSTRYHYEMFDLEGRELVLYHWHPVGVSNISFPHVHAACAPRVFLPRPNTDQGRPINVDNLHLPTSRVHLEDVIELLIRDFGVEPRPAFLDTWRDVLRGNREAVRRGSGWSWWVEDEENTQQS